jgi:LmbE family N-acetylglucosaminyl deacetylase
VLLTHWKGSFHTDHRSTYQNVMASLFFAGLRAFVREHPAHSPAKVLFCENWEDIEEYVPDLYLDVTEVWDRFIHAMRAYSLFRGEVATFPYEQWYQGASLMRGAEAGFGRAVTMMRPESAYSRRRPITSLAD